ncbi:membrane protein insertion efficiency factor YidD [bacterium]|nr:membrane protein insertion efficiency factor YidD [bacterium]
MKFLNEIAVLLIKLYRVTISRLFPYTCRFEPTCSHYAETSIKRFGIFWGSIISMWRILRCNPFSRGGIDPVPQNLDEWREKFFVKRKSRS